MIINTQNIPKKLKLAGPPLLLLAVAILVYVPYLWTSDLVGYKDQFYQDHTLRVLAGQFWRQGKIPLWNPYNLTGDPLAGQLYVGAFNPLIVAYVFFSPLIAHKLLLVFTLWWSGMGIWLWAGHHGIPNRYRIFLSLMALLMPTRWFTQSFYGRDTIIWFPWMLWGADHLGECKRLSLRWILINSLIWGFSFLGGHTHLWFYMAVITIFYFLFYKRAIFRFVFVIPLFILIIFPQLASSLPLISESHRMEANFCHINYQFSADEPLLYFYPFKDNNQYGKSNTYISPILLVASFLLLFKRGQAYQYYRLLTASSIILAVFFLSPLPCSMPILNHLRWHARFVGSIFPYLMIMTFSGFIQSTLLMARRLIAPVVIMLGIYMGMGVISFIFFKNNLESVRFIFNTEFIFIFLVLILSLSHRHQHYWIALVLSMIVVAQYTLEYRHLINLDLKGNHWNLAAKLRQEVISRYSLIRVFSPTHQGTPITGFEANLNAIDGIYQAGLYPGSVHNPVFIQMGGLRLDWNPKVWTLFGVDTFIIPDNIRWGAESFLMSYVLKNYSILAQPVPGMSGCIHFRTQGENRKVSHARGWFYTSERYTGTLQHLPGGEEVDIPFPSGVRAATLICSIEPDEPPLLIIQNRDQTYFISRADSFSPEHRLILPKGLDSPWFGYHNDDSVVLVASKKGNLIILNIDRTTGRIDYTGNPIHDVIHVLPFILLPEGETPKFLVLRQPFRFSYVSRETVEPAPLPQHLPKLWFNRMMNYFYVERTYILRDRQWRKRDYLPSLGLTIYHFNGSTFPSIWTVSQVRTINWREFTRLLVTGPLNRFKHEAFVKDPKLSRKLPGDRDPKILLQRWTADSIRIKIREGDAQFLVIRLRNYPCWNARVDNQQVSMFTVNFIMSAIKVPPGNHTVELKCTMGNLLKYTVNWLLKPLKLSHEQSLIDHELSRKTLLRSPVHPGGKII